MINKQINLLKYYDHFNAQSTVAEIAMLKIIHSTYQKQLYLILNYTIGINTKCASAIRNIQYHSGNFTTASIDNFLPKL